MSSEGDFIALMRNLAHTTAARGLMDDAAVLDIAALSDGSLVLTSDTLVEGVHFLETDPADSVGWKLAAVNLSDLAAKGARPVGCLMNYALSGDAIWDAEFAKGLSTALTRYDMALLGGDTVAMPTGAPRSMTLTAIGRVAAGASVPSRSGAQAGDVLYVTGPVGDAGAGLKLLAAGQNEPQALVDAYRRPQPRLDAGFALAPHAHAMMDISDGLLIDAQRMAQASGVAIIVNHVPISAPYRALDGDSQSALIEAACAGDDYQLLIAWPADQPLPPDSDLIRIGRVGAGAGLALEIGGRPVALPERLGWQHGDTPSQAPTN
ncbi:MAG: thiamine-phosphate kinase [Sphingobium sp.]